MAIIVLRQHVGGLHGTGETAGHGNMYDLVIVFEQAVPQCSYGFRSGLRGGYVTFGVLLKILEELGLVHVDIFKIFFFIYKKWHWKHVDAKVFCLGWRYTAVAVCNDCNRFHSDGPPCWICIFGRCSCFLTGISQVYHRKLPLSFTV